MLALKVLALKVCERWGGDVAKGRIEVPTLAAFVQHRRQSRGQSQAELARGIRYSATYVAQIEQGKQENPSPVVLEGLVEALNLEQEEATYLYSLAGRVRNEMPLVSQLPVSESERAYADTLAPHLAAFVDYRWNVVYANAEYQDIFRNIDQAKNVLEWFFFYDESRAVMVEWESEARLTVAWLRVLMAKEPEVSDTSLLERLTEAPRFREIWNEYDIVAGRRRMPMKVRDIDTDRIFVLRAQVWPSPTRRDLQFYLGMLDEQGLAARS